MADGVSLERYKTAVRQVYFALASSEDGMTATQITKATGVPIGVVRTVLDHNLLFYVDRWVVGKNKANTKVWMAVNFNHPGNCPEPKGDV